MIVVLHKTQVLCYPALLNIVLLIVFTLFTVPSSKALCSLCKAKLAVALCYINLTDDL